MPNRQKFLVFHYFFYIQDVYPLACKIANNGILLIMSVYSLNRAPSHSYSGTSTTFTVFMLRFTSTPFLGVLLPLQANKNIKRKIGTRYFINLIFYS